MQSTSATYAPYTSLRKVELAFDFGVVAPEAAQSAVSPSAKRAWIEIVLNAEVHLQTRRRPLRRGRG